MKKLALLIFVLFLTNSIFAQKSNDTIISNNPSNLKAKVMYFHITNRCRTCYSIEKFVMQTVDSIFKSELETGIIDLFIINCELPEYKELAQKYDAYGATLALTAVKNGKEIKTEDLTTWAFQKVHKPDIFVIELKQKINQIIH